MKCIVVFSNPLLMVRPTGKRFSGVIFQSRKLFSTRGAGDPVNSSVTARMTMIPLDEEYECSWYKGIPTVMSGISLYLSILSFLSKIFRYLSSIGESLYRSKMNGEYSAKLP